MLQITLKAARINADLALNEVSGMTGISKEVLRNYESGRTEIPARVLKRLVEVYEVTIDDIKLPETK